MDRTGDRLLRRDAILFILALGGLSNQETRRRGNWYGIVGMAIALVATILGTGHRQLRR